MGFGLVRIQELAASRACCPDAQRRARVDTAAAKPGRASVPASPNFAFTENPLLTLAFDLNAWAEGAWVIAPHCNGGAAREGNVPFLLVTTTTTSKQAGAKGGNVLLLSGSVHWKNIKQMTNYWAYQTGGYWNAW
jgi:hypothetical protein